MKDGSARDRAEEDDLWLPVKWQGLKGKLHQ